MRRDVNVASLTSPMSLFELPPSAQQDKSQLTLPPYAECFSPFAADNSVGGSDKLHETWPAESVYTAH